MSAEPVVKCFQVIEESQVGMSNGVEDSILRKHFRFERGKKAFSESIVIAVAPGTHTLLPTVTGKGLADPLASVLATTIGVKDSIRKDGAGGLLNSVDDEIGMEGGGGFPTEHAAAEKVDDDREIKPALFGGKIGYVGNDLLAGSRGRSVFFQEIGRRMSGMIRLGGFGPERASGPGTKACRAHESGDAVAGAGKLAIPEFCGHAGAAVSTGVAMGVDGFDLAQENGVGLSTGPGDLLARGVVS